MVRIGERIRQRLEETGHTTAWLAGQLGCHRTNLYKIYDKPSIDTGMLLRISRILDYDFFAVYSNEL